MEKIESVTLTANNTIEIITREISNEMLSCYPPRKAPDLIWKNIYGVVNGQITLLETKRGKIQNKIIEESITFE